MKQRLLFVAMSSMMATNPLYANTQTSEQQMEEVKVVQSSPVKHNILDSVHPVTIIDGEELRKKTEQNLGETLANEVGVHASSFGPGASRPTIRGFERQRVKILENSIDVMDVANVSEDHAVGLDSSNANRIEILRGPEALVYGSGAIGGIINVFNNRIPVDVTEAFTGFADVQFGSNADQKSAIFDISGSNGEFAWHIDASRREADDLEISGFAELEEAHEEEEHEEEGHEEEEQVPGLVENSAFETDSAAAGLVWKSDKLQLGFSVSRFETLYGVPGHAHGHGEEGHEEEHEEGEHGDEEHEEEGHGEEEEQVAIDLEQTRYTVFANVDLAGQFFESVKVQLGLADYEHVEQEGDEIGTMFENDQYELRVEALHQPINGWRGAFGLQVGERDFVAIGEEAFVPANKIDQLALFWVGTNELSDSIELESGLRFESQDIDVQNSPASSSHDAFSFSFGISKKLNDNSTLAASITRAERNPTAEELFSFGPHVGTNSFEIGDANLDSEVANNLDIGFRKDFGRFNLLANVFYNQYSDYLFLQATGAEEDELPVFVHQQQDADFYGYEIEFSGSLLESNNWSTGFDLFTDYTRASLDNAGDLPRIPPMRFGAGISTTNDNWSLGADWIYHAEQDRIGAFETVTDSYDLLSIDIAYNFEASGIDWSVYLKGRNLSDSDGRRHTSRLKDLVPIAGRNVTVGLRSNW